MIKKSFYLFLILSVFFSPKYLNAQSDSAVGYTELSLVFISSACSINREQFSPVVKDYEGKIFNYFRLPPQVTSQGIIRSDENEFGQATRIVVGMEVSLGSADSGYKINFLKNDVPVEKAPSHLTLAYGIAVEPPTGEDQPQPGKQPQPRKNEWINEGGKIGSPPMINVSKEFISKLCDKGQSKYWHSAYYCGDKYCTIKQTKPYLTTMGISECRVFPHKKFETEVKKVTSIPDVYMASNGYEAHV
ncbi:MAG: hypothetical protein N3F05_04580, partial [Candidatus Diapherotrites archaeon]|nr:hypothetical protein [Candidatus Diapherotrites archaeon]